MKPYILQFLQFYQRYISFLFGPCCRFTPTCSQYAIEAFTHHKISTAAYLTFKRICKCHPFSTGGFDPLPKDK